jgi:hypothetical protein
MEERHICFVPMLDDSRELYRGQIACTCPKGEDHDSIYWDSLLAEAHSILDAD